MRNPRRGRRDDRRRVEDPQSPGGTGCLNPGKQQARRAPSASRARAPGAPRGLGRRTEPLRGHHDDRHGRVQRDRGTGCAVPQRGLRRHPPVHLRLRPDDVGLDPAHPRTHRPGRRLRGGDGADLGPGGRHRHRPAEHDRELPVHPVLPGVVPTDHRVERLRDLGTVRLQPGCRGRRVTLVHEGMGDGG